MIAEKAKSQKSLICASLLHDYGHFILEDPDALVKNNLDGIVCSAKEVSIVKKVFY